MESPFVIQTATPKDVSLILQFIKELAQYEKLLHEVKATEEHLHNTLFGPKPYAEVILGYENQKPVSFALYFYNYSTFLGKPGLYLEDLYVKPEARGKGIAMKMLKHLANTALEKDCGRMEWWVLDWNELAIGFYRRLGARPMSDWTVYRLDEAGVRKLAET